MAPGRKRGAKGLKTKSELSLGDLVLAKVKGFPAWPAKISRPEDWKHAPDSKKYFVQFFGTLEIAFVAPADIQAFTSESKNKLSSRCQGKTVKHFSQAVKEICEEFELLQRKKISSTIDDDNGRNIASVSHSVDPVLDEILEDSDNCGMDSEEPNSELEIKVECQYVKPCSLDDMNYGLSPHLSSGRRNKLSTNLSNFVKESVNGFRDIKAGDWGTDGGQGSLANSAQTRLAIGLKRKHDPANGRNRDSIVLREHIGDGLQTNLVSGGQKKVSSAEISRSDLDVGSKKFLKEKTYMPALDDDKMDAEAIFDGNTEIIPRKKMKFHNDYEHHISRANEAPFPAKMDNIDLKRLTSGGKADNLEVQPSSNESNHSTDEDDLPPIKRHRRALGVVSSSSLMSQNRSGNSASQKSGLVYPKKVQSSIMQPTTKRRAVRLCDEDDDELPKTPIHSGFAHKVSVVPCVSDSRKKSFKREESYTNGQVVVRNLGRVEDKSKEHAQPSLASNKASSPAAQQSVKKRTTESSVNSCHSPTHLVIEKNSLMEAKPVIVSPKMSPHPVTATKADPQKKHFGKLPDCISPRKVLPGPGANKATTSERLTSNLNQSISERSKPTSSVERRKSTPKSELKINDPVLLVGNPDESINSSGERIDAGKDTQTSLPIDLTISDPGMSMKHLIAAAQARKRQSNLQNSNGNPRRLIPDADMNRQSPCVIIATSVVESSNSLQIKVQGHPTSSPPSHDGHQLSSVNEHDEDLEERRASSGHQASGSSLSGGTEASVARDAFEGMIETLSRTKESIGRATRLAIDCAKFGIANEIVELLIQKLENEPSFHRKVDLFFLVDSITQCSHSQRGIAGASYIPIVQAALPRLIGAAAPTGTGTQENRRQCHKVLRLWLERNILPEYVLRPFMDDIRAMNDNSSAGFCQRRPSRADRPINDPIREMEGMFVDEYGSNATFQLPGLLPSHLFEEEEEEEEEDNFPIKLCKEVINSSPGKDHENYTVTPSDRRHCILEEVDGELEMEDVSGHQKDERLLIASDTPLLEPKLDVNFISSSTITSTMLPSPEGSPPLPPGSPPVTPPLPTSPPPLSPPPPTSPPPPPPSSPPPPPPPPPPSSPQHPFLPPVDPPRFSQLLPPQPVLMSQYMLPFPSTMLSQSIAYHLTPTLHEISITSSGNQAANMVSNTQVSNISAPIRSEVFSKQPSFLSPAAVSSAREHASYNSLRIEHGQGDACMKPHAPQQRQQFLMGNASFGQRPLCPEPPQIPSHFSYSNLVHLYQPYSYLLPNHSDGSRICAIDEHRKMPLNDFSADRPSSGWMTGGNFGPPPERALANTVKVHPPVENSQPPAPSVPGAPLMPSRPDMSAVNWRPT